MLNKIFYGFLFLILLSCFKENIIENGKFVKLNYTIKLENRNIYESSKILNKPLEFIIGKKMIITGLEKALFGLKTGDKKTIKIDKKDAYGDYNDNAVLEYSRTDFPDEYKFEIGKVLLAKKEGMEYSARIKNYNEKTILVDFNHPLAGKNLIFDVEILEIH